MSFLAINNYWSSFYSISISQSLSKADGDEEISSLTTEKPSKPKQVQLPKAAVESSDIDKVFNYFVDFFTNFHTMLGFNCNQKGNCKYDKNFVIPPVENTCVICFSLYLIIHLVGSSPHQLFLPWPLLQSNCHGFNCQSWGCGCNLSNGLQRSLPEVGTWKFDQNITFTF